MTQYFKYYALLILMQCSYLIDGQDTIPTQIIPEILLINNRPKLLFPWTYQSDTLQLIDIFQSSLRQAFDQQVGIQAFNGENFAQDVRIAIRGYGSRSSFGIRGIRLYQDGIPLTSPDGTTQLDEISSFDIQSMDILRSGLAARLGNSSGGAIALKSGKYMDGGNILTQIGQYGSTNLGLKLGISNEKLSNLTSVNHHYFVGKREHSKSSNTTIYNKMRYFIHNKWQLEWLTGFYFSPIGMDAGALNLTEIGVNKFAGNIRNTDFNAGESVKGMMTALVSKYFINDHSSYQSYIFYRKRDFMARLPFEVGGWVQLERDFVGSNHSYLYTGLKNTLISVGTSAEYQRDHRILSRNIKGEKGGESANQIENVQNFALYQEIQWAQSKWEIHQLLRWDLNQYKLKDQYLNDGILNGDQSFTNINGALGLGYKMNKCHQVFSNFSTSFEMPTLNELTNNPSGQGFNPDLVPEKSWQLEIGHRFTKTPKFNVQTSIFYIRIKDQILSYELPDTPGRSYYRNASTTIRKGIETTIGIYPTDRLNFMLNYTWSDFNYGLYTVGNLDNSGNSQTLTPAHKIQLNIAMPIGQNIGTQINMGYTAEMWLDDANSQKTEDYGECNISIYSTEKFSRRTQIGLIGNNLFNLMPYSNFRVNAAAMRYYEVASPMNFAVFATLKW